MGVVGAAAGSILFAVLGELLALVWEWRDELPVAFTHLAGAITGGGIGFAWGASKNRRNAITAALVVGLACIALAAYGGVILYGMGSSEPNEERGMI